MKPLYQIVLLASVTTPLTAILSLDVQAFVTPVRTAAADAVFAGGAAVVGALTRHSRLVLHAPHSALPPTTQPTPNEIAAYTR